MAYLTTLPSFWVSGSEALFHAIILKPPRLPIFAELGVGEDLQREPARHLLALEDPTLHARVRVELLRSRDAM